MQLKNFSNTAKINQYTNPSKNSIPCPFLSRRGWCVRGNSCDFQHPVHPVPARNKDKIPCPFLQRRGFCLKRDQCDFFHYGLSYGMTAPIPVTSKPIHILRLPYHTTKDLQLK